jgi:inner membrane protein
VPAHFGLADRQDRIQWGQAYLAVGLSDIRGIKARPALRWQAAPWLSRQAPRTGSSRAACTPLRAAVTAASYEFALSRRRGSDGAPELCRSGGKPRGAALGVAHRASSAVPAGGRTVTDAGFAARWRTSYFSTNGEQLLDQCGGRECAALAENALGVAFIQPVDIYLQAERAVKYGVLFVGLTFAAFFLFELFKRLAIHPIQYGLVGIALAIFYLLLLSLSEHLARSVVPDRGGRPSACWLRRCQLRSVLRAAGFRRCSPPLASYVLLRLRISRC